MSTLNQTNVQQAPKAYNSGRFLPQRSFLKLKWLLLAGLTSSHLTYGAESLLEMKSPDSDDDGASVRTGSTFGSVGFGYEASKWDGERIALQSSVKLEHFLKAFERTALKPKPDKIYLKRLRSWATREHLIARALLGHVLLRQDKTSSEGQDYLEEAQEDLIDKAGNPGEEGKDEGAQLCIGLMYWWGHALEKDEEEGREWLEPLAKSGNKIARSVLNENNRDSVLTPAEGGGGGGGGGSRSSGNANRARASVPRPDLSAPALASIPASPLSTQARVPDAVVAPYLKAGQDINKPDAEDWTPLQCAAKRGDVEGCLGLIQRGAAADKARNDGCTPLRVAAGFGHRKVCELLLSKGATVDKSRSDHTTPLMLAAEQGHRDVCEVLLAKGAAVDKANKSGFTPLMIAAQKGHREVCELLLAKGAAVDKAMNDGFTPLFIAAQRGHREVCELLLAKGAAVDKALNDGWTPLMIAAQLGHREVCELLLAKGAKVDQPKDGGFTPLYVAAEYGHREVCELLLAKGANPLKRENNGCTPIDVAKTEEIRNILKRY